MNSQVGSNLEFTPLQRRCIMQSLERIQQDGIRSRRRGWAIAALVIIGGIWALLRWLGLLAIVVVLSGCAAGMQRQLTELSLIGPVTSDSVVTHADGTTSRVSTVKSPSEAELRLKMAYILTRAEVEKAKHYFPYDGRWYGPGFYGDRYYQQQPYAYGGCNGCGTYQPYRRP